MTFTAPQQRNAVSQGVALGLVVEGRDTFPQGKLKLDLAFEGAWNSWGGQHKSPFPQVTTDLKNGSGGMHVMTRADQAKKVYGLHWERHGGEVRVCARQPDWVANDPEDVEYALQFIRGGTPLGAWLELAQGVLERLDR